MVLIRSSLTTHDTEFQFHFKPFPEELRKKKSIYVTTTGKTGIDNTQPGKDIF